MAASLLCSLDGSARSLLSELEDAGNTNYNTIKELLLKRFGPVRLTEVHEQALQEIRLARGQSIRELTPEILRLSKLAYPEFSVEARNRMAIKALINAVADKDKDIKDKAPASLDDACSYYERFRILTGSGNPRATVRGVKSAEDKDPFQQLTPKEDETVLSLRRQCDHTDQQLQQLRENTVQQFQQLSSIVSQQSENTAQQYQQMTSSVNQLTAAVTQLLTNRPAEPALAPQPQSSLSTSAPAFQPAANYGQVPRSRARVAINLGIGLNTAHNQLSTSSLRASTDPAQRLR